MSSFVIESKGLNKLINDMDGYTRDLNKKVTETIDRAGNAVLDYAISNHRFETQSGQLESSVTFEYSRMGNLHTAELYLKDSFTTSSNGNSYGDFIHEGTYEGYNESPIAPSYSYTSGSDGWDADPFLWIAINEKWNLRRRMKGVMDRLKKRYERL